MRSGLLVWRPNLETGKLEELSGPLKANWELSELQRYGYYNQEEHAENEVDESLRTFPWQMSLSSLCRTASA